jgi:YHS domain-containing protein
LSNHWFANADGVVLNGYDVVAYHLEDRAILGSSEHSTTYDHATFYFHSPETMAAFAKSPQTFVPAFGGWCAYGIIDKHFTPPDPRTFKIYDGQLLVFFNELHAGAPVNTKLLWQANERKLFEKATENWPGMIQ